MRRYCKDCGYDISATPTGSFSLGACPECGRGFQDGDNSTFSDEPLKQPQFWVIALVIAGLIACTLLASKLGR